MSGEKGSVSS